MHFISSGEGSVVILIHGLFGNLDNLKGLAKHLESSHKVIRVDVPNHGLSPHWDAMDYPKLGQAILALMADNNIEQAHLVGHSMGGKIAMAAALASPEKVTSLVVADIAPVSYHERHNLIFNALQNIDLDGVQDRTQALQALTSAGIDEGTAQFLLKNLSRTATGFKWKMNLDGLQACYPSLIGWYNDISLTDFAQYKQATLFIRGADSDYVTADHREAIIKQFPRVQAKTIEGAGHWLHAQKPTIFNRIVSDFINKHDRQ